MSTDQRNPITLPAASDLTGSLYCGVTLNTSGQVVLPNANGTILGVLTTITPSPSANFASGIWTMGDGKIKARYGGTVTAADPLKVTSAGKFITASGSDVAAGMQVAIAVKSGSNNDIGEIVLTGGTGAAALTGFDDIVLGTTPPSNTTPTTFAQVTGTKTGALAAGIYSGQQKRIAQSVATGTPVGTITGTFKTLTGSAATTLALGTATGFIVDLMWDGAAWRATSAIGGTGSSLS
ncbi:MAG TPA: hypothetical protein VFQ42_22370 [Mycobacterium sp.]|nr:hypothetical protein [Mycobacterium sp.]